MLADSAYGKSRIRLVQVLRRGDRDDLRDLTVAVRFRGDYDASYIEGDNSAVLPTDTMKNTVYAVAARHPIKDPEDFGLALAQHFIDRNPRLREVRIDLREHPWDRVALGAREHGQAFVRREGGMRTATVRMDRRAARVGAGIRQLVVLKSARSAFAGFIKDEYTTLPETHDRLLATAMTATWMYQEPLSDYGTLWRAIRTTLLDTFAEHDSKSVQHTLHAMAAAVLDTAGDVSAVRLVMPNKHHLPVDVSRFGLQHRNEIFVPTDEPYGLIEATLVRK